MLDVLPICKLNSVVHWFECPLCLVGQEHSGKMQGYKRHAKDVGL
jgi:hypothetical protein